VMGLAITAQMRGYHSDGNAPPMPPPEPIPDTPTGM
jgi:hypothetical protein